MSGSHQRLILERCRLEHMAMRQSPYVWAGCCQEKSFLLHLAALGQSILPSFGLLASGNQQRKLEWCGFGGF